jgi:hypothetical protein
MGDDVYVLLENISPKGNSLLLLNRKISENARWLNAESLFNISALQAGRFFLLALGSRNCLFVYGD